MERHTLRVLEFDKVLEIISRKTVTPYGKDRVLSREPFLERSMALDAQRRVTEAKTLLEKGAPAPLESHQDVEEAWDRGEKGAALSAEEIFHTGIFLRSVRLVKDFLERNHTESFAALAGRLHPVPALEKRIMQSISAAFQIADDASSRLREIRLQTRRADQRLLEKLQEMIHSPSLSPSLQEPLVTKRSGRYVVPVKETHRGQFKGILHDRSASGATLFMEPMAVVELNNRIIQLGLEEKEEEEAILRSLSAEIGKNGGALSASRRAAAEIDEAFAAARWSAEERGIPPAIADRPLVDLAGARHPLLGKKAVPIDVELGKTFRTLIVTGPNTGGKTVSLKTAGLFAALALCGFHLPAERAEVGMVEKIFADIGDEQSIQQNLSTFSSHLSRILGFLKEADGRSLILLDEIGAGTDPREGAALAMALLHHFHESGSLTIATTHYAELKIFAEQTQGMANASMTFDEETLAPAFRLAIGRPGRSLALTIAAKMGLPDEVLIDARNRLDAESLEMENLLAALEKKENELSAERGKLSSEKEKLNEALARAEEERKKAAALHREARDQLLEWKSAIRGRMEELKSASLEKVSKLESEASSAIEAEEEKIPPPVAPEAASSPFDPAAAKPGDRVWISSLRLSGRILSIGKERALVEAGALKVQRPFDDLAAQRPEPAAAREVPDAAYSAVTPTARELHLRGMRGEEAVEELDKYLDRAVLSPYSLLRIVHGKGGGVLRRMIRERLQSHPMVAGFRSGAPEEGGDGVTIVELRK